MPVPTAYTEDQLAEYMHSVLGQVAVALGLEAPLSYHEAIVDTLLAYGDGVTIAQATNIKKLRALAKLKAWEVAKAHAAAYVSQSIGGASISTSDMGRMIAENLEAARVYAWAYEPIYAVEVSTVTHYDPYNSPFDIEASE